MLDYEAQYQLKKYYDKLYRNMALFGRVCFPTALNKDVPPFHGEVYKDLANPTERRVAIAAPRGTAKSTTTSLIFPLWKTAFKRSDEDLFIVIISESQAQSINFLSRIKYHLNNSDKYKELFGDMGIATAKRWTNTDVVLANGTRIVAVGTGQRVRGFIEGDTRPNLIIVDDFESELNAYTPEARAKNRKWMTEAVIPSLSDEGKVVMIGTVISEDCFLYWVKESSAWKVLWYSIIDSDTGKLLWPERFPQDRIDAIKEEYASVGNLNGFYQEYMNIAQDPDNAPFKPEWVKRHHYDYEIINGQPCMVKETGEEKKIIPVEVYCGVDPASSLAMRADFFVVATIGIDNEGNKYSIDIFRDKISPELQPGKIIEIYKKYRPRRMKVETVGYQEALRTAVRQLMQEEGLYIPGIEKGVKPRNRKSERLLSLVPMFARGQFYFRPEDLEAEKEFLSYPKGQHDDVMDAIWTALDGAKPCRHAEISENPEKMKKNKKVLDWMVL
jgi:predicted phage terminase large subunit-like protein